MAMTLRLTDEETEALRRWAEAEGLSMNDAVRTALRETLGRRRRAAGVGEPAGRARPARRHVIEFLDVDDLIRLAACELGDPPPIRDLGLLGSAAARPQTSAFGQDAYPDLWAKAAALLHSIVKNDALVDGNKRLGWLATTTFLELNGVDVTGGDEDDTVAFVLDVAAGRHDIADVAARLRDLLGGDQYQWRQR